MKKDVKSSRIWQLLCVRARMTSHVSRVRDMSASATSSKSRLGGGGEDAAADAETMRNLAYVVNSANDNIQQLQKTVRQQERELLEKHEQATALQRNYETLSRIRQADQKEFLLLKAQTAEQHEQLQDLQSRLASEQETVGALEARLSEMTAAQASVQKLQLQLQDLSRERDEQKAEASKARASAAELTESNKALKLNVDKLTRAQHEVLQRVRKADEAARQLQSEKEAAEGAPAAAGGKLSVQERQLKVFLEANNALEADLRKQMQRVAQLERRKQEMEAEAATVEAYYKARLEEMQSQYDRLLADIEGAKQAAQDQVFRTFDDNAPRLSPRGR